MAVIVVIGVAAQVLWLIAFAVPVVRFLHGLARALGGG